MCFLPDTKHMRGFQHNLFISWVLLCVKHKSKSEILAFLCTPALLETWNRCQEVHLLDTLFRYMWYIHTSINTICNFPLTSTVPYSIIKYSCYRFFYVFLQTTRGESERREYVLLQLCIGFSTTEIFSNLDLWQVHKA